jgi:hypothetical protein
VRLPKEHGALSPEAFGSHDDWLDHLFDEELFLRSEITEIYRRGGDAGIERLPFDADKLETGRLQLLLDLLLEIAQLVRVFALLTSVELVHARANKREKRHVSTATSIRESSSSLNRSSSDFIRRLLFVQTMRQ